MTTKHEYPRDPVDGQELAEVLSALSNPHRLRIIATLSQGRTYVSELARTVGLSRPLVHMHLQRLESVGLIEGSLELSPEGKAQKFYDLTAFSFSLTPATIAAAVAALPAATPSRRST